ncbi:TonB-dependent receptor [Emticicia sp. SJ17W-69]|uniref:TonB-dependent receptor n=1 Tax=Emticicia sp. SJ17W-69 TaxID=3421657 RepID=UPI003EBB031C
MKQHYIYLLFVMFSLCKIQSFAQKDSLYPITLELKKANINEFVKHVEKQTNLYFYYDISEFDSLAIDIVVRQQPIRKVLNQIFEKTAFQYIIDEESRIFLTKGRILNLSIPTDFFISINENKTKKIQSDTNNIDNLEPQQKAIWENKLYEIGKKTTKNIQKTYNISGFVKDAANGEAVIGASVFIEEPRIGISTDQNGYYTLNLPKGRHTLQIRSIGIKDTKRQIFIYGNGKFNIDLAGTAVILNNVTITAQKESNIKSTQMGVQKVDIKAIKQVPVVFGEADILKVITTLPGVKTTGEASTGLNVRGGSADQNLILFNDSPIYNPSHFFGMFSAFNPEIVKDVELFKSSIPARYGGRLSSVLNINTREGNKEKITGSAGIGLLTSRLNIEGPLSKGKTSFILGGRTTYANWLLNLLPDPYKGSKASFYDINLDITHEINKKNNIYLTTYLSQDHFNLNSDTLFGYGNKNVSLKWKHTYNNQLSSTFVGGFTNYKYQINSQKLPLSAYSLGFDINQAFFKAHFNYYLSPKHTLDFGLNSLHYQLHPGSYLPSGNESLVKPDIIATEQAIESALYISDSYTINDALTLDAGIRLSVFNYLGPHDVNTYSEGLPRTENTLVNTISDSKSNVLKTYSAPEYRASMRYTFNDHFSLKAGFNTQQQYIHSISNTASIAPTDVWKLSDTNIKPQHGSQISLGAYNNFKSNAIETSIEVYYKNIQNFLDYKSGAQLIMNHHIETDVIATKGKAYGIEFLIKKVKGKLNGWVGYTYSRILLKQDDPLAGELINKGKFYPANYDKPHDVTLVGNYRFSHRFSVSLNTTYSTGRPLTLPAGVYNYAGAIRTLYLERNAYRIPDYFRTDFSMNLEGNHKIHQKTHNSWTLGVYNITGRKNPYSVYYISENGQTNGYKLSIFGSAIPFINYNIRF